MYTMEHMRTDYSLQSKITIIGLLCQSNYKCIKTQTSAQSGGGGSLQYNVLIDELDNLREREVKATHHDDSNLLSTHIQLMKESAILVPYNSRRIIANPKM